MAALSEPVRGYRAFASVFCVCSLPDERDVFFLAVHGTEVGTGWDLTVVLL